MEIGSAYLTQGIGLRPQPWARISRPVGPVLLGALSMSILHQRGGRRCHALNAGSRLQPSLDPIPHRPTKQNMAVHEIGYYRCSIQDIDFPLKGVPLPLELSAELLGGIFDSGVSAVGQPHAQRLPEADSRKLADRLGYRAVQVLKYPVVRVYTASHCSLRRESLIS